jgi:hypothetical protein
MKVSLVALAYMISPLVACSSSPPSPSDTSKFIGNWQYEPGSAIIVDCPNAAPQMINLSKSAPGGQPGHFTFSEKSDNLVHEVDARGCQYDWTVSGNDASAIPNQSCATFPDGKGGNRVVLLKSGTKSTSDGTTMTVDVQFRDTSATCAISVRGTAAKF